MYFAVGIHEASSFEVLPKNFGLIEAKRHWLAVGSGGDDASKLMNLQDAETDAGLYLELFLKALGELLVALGCDDGERVHLEAAQALALLIHAKAQPTPNCLSTLLLG